MCMSISATATAFALGNSTALAKPPHHRYTDPACPEVGTWLIGAGVLAILGIQSMRRKMIRIKAQASNGPVA